jgi:hypothetical protein
MKLNKKIRIFALVTAVIACLSTVTAFAADKLDKNMAGEGMSFAERFEFALQGTATGMLMVFAVQGTSPLDFLNTTLVSAEVVKTLVGSFGLVLVAPFTALVGAWIFTFRRKR